MNLVSDAPSRAMVLGAMGLTVAILWQLPAAGADSAMAWLVATAMAIAGTARLAAGPVRDPAQVPARDATRMLSQLEIPDAVWRVMDVRIALTQGERREFRGPLKVAGDGLVAELETALDGARAELAEDAELGARLVLTRPLASRGRARALLGHLAADGASVALFALAALTTVFCGAVVRGASPIARPAELMAGLPFAAVVLSVFTMHALARTIALRLHGVKARGPFFVPLPVPPGTAGAVIPAHVPTRAALFDATFWGLATALMTAFGALAFGLSHSPVVVAETGPAAGVGVGQSIALALVARSVLGGAMTYGDHIVFSPIAAGAWLSLFILVLRMLPAGGLDGGAVTRSLFGTAAGRGVSRVAQVGLLVAAALARPAALPWLIGAFLMARKVVPPQDDVTQLTLGRRVAGALLFAVWFLLAVPLPNALHQPLGIRPPRVIVPVASRVALTI